MALPHNKSSIARAAEFLLHDRCMPEVASIMMQASEELPLDAMIVVSDSWQKSIEKSDASVMHEVARGFLEKAREKRIEDLPNQQSSSYWTPLDGNPSYGGRELDLNTIMEIVRDFDARILGDQDADSDRPYEVYVELDGNQQLRIAIALQEFGGKMSDQFVLRTQRHISMTSNFGPVI